jgi:hypothetical protein
MQAAPSFLTTKKRGAIAPRQTLQILVAVARKGSGFELKSGLCER